MAKRIFCVVFCAAVLFTEFSVFAQAQAGSSYQNIGPKKQLATIIFAGLGGAVLGLSTLSFYGRPQEKLNNIAIGFAIGVIGGTLYTTYQTATQPRSYYSEHFAPETQKIDPLQLAEPQPITLSYQIDF